jgi:translation initiation factor IF-1
VKEPPLILEGTVVAAHRNYLFDVAFDGGHVARCYIAGATIKNRIFIAVGDAVRCELSAYDLQKGRIVYRLSK